MKNRIIIISIIFFMAGVLIILLKPTLHKPFQVSIIDYVIKFDKTIKKTTDYTYIKGNNE